MRSILFVPLVIFASAISATADSAPQPGDPLAVADSAAGDVLARYLTQDRNVPDSPAAAVLGLSPSVVQHPGTPVEFQTALLRAVDANGNIDEGGAIDINPYMAYAGDQVTIRDYYNNFLVRLLSNTQLSLAAVQGTGSSDKATKVAIGLHMSLLWDDPRLNARMLGCMGDELVKQLNAIPFLPPHPTPQQVADNASARAKAEAAAKTDIDNCRSKFQPLYSGGLSFGVAPTWESQSKSLGGLRSTGFSAWGSASYVLSFGKAVAPGLSDIGTIFANTMYQTDKQVSDPLNPSAFVNANILTSSAGLRFNTGELGPISNLDWSIDGGHVLERPAHEHSQTYWQYNGDLQFSIPSISSGVVFDLSFGRTSGKTKDNTLSNFTLRWKFNNNSNATPTSGQ